MIQVKFIPKIFLIFVAVCIFSACSHTNLETTQSPQNEIEPQKEVVIHDDGIFSIAIIPDTQQEVVTDHAISNKYFYNRINWLVSNSASDLLDLRFVAHTGDVVNWGNEDEEQFKIAYEAMSLLNKAGIPVIYAIGNHDTAAVTVGGSAADPKNTKARLRNTEKFNKYFSTNHHDYLITFEDKKIDNSYYSFTAENAKWLVISLELWPREDVINWAEGVISKNPDHNVIIVTHSYLTSTGDIYQKSDYGHCSPQVLYDRIISRYANIKFVFSGHTGKALHRVDYGVNGNKIVSILGCFHSNQSNPVQILEIDTLLQSINIRTYSPIENSTWNEFSATISDMSFILTE